VPVEPCQAGQAVACGCGATLEVPTMLKLVKLQRVDPELTPARRPPSWGMRQRLILVGATITLAAMTAAFYFFWNRPILSLREPDREFIRQHVEAFSPVETWQLWHVLRAQRLDRRHPADNPLYREAAFRYRLAMGAALFFAASGLGLVIAGLWAGAGRRPGGHRAGIKY
jgi:hypothetical protein